MILVNIFGDKVENDNLNLYFGKPATSVQGNYSALIPRLCHVIQFTQLLRFLWGDMVQIKDQTYP